MESNHGRKIIREKRKNKNFIIYTLIVLGIGILIGFMF